MEVGSTQVLTVLNLGSGGFSTLYTTSRSIESPVWSGDRIYFMEYSGSGYDGRFDVQLKSDQVIRRGIGNLGNILGLTPKGSR